jgi:NAD(P)-dependent dehydrogenase (short-subunit alcohol dehydrogenase family)
VNELKGKAAVITGASKGIGEATARELARLGVAVVLAARSSDRIDAIANEIRQAGGRALAIACDVSRYQDIAAAVAECRSEFGRIDILVNNAGVIEPISRLAESDPDAWSHAADINYKGVYFGLRAALPAMLEQGGGAIVNISSGAATGAMEGWSHYCSAKAAALSLTRCVHAEYGDDGIQIVGLSPGTVATEMQVLIKGSGINPVSQLDPSVHISAEIPARAIAWLCTKDAAEFAGGDVSLRDEEIRRRISI